MNFLTARTYYRCSLQGGPKKLYSHYQKSHH